MKNILTYLAISCLYVLQVGFFNNLSFPMAIEMLWDILWRAEKI